MRFTRIAAIAGLALLAFLCWLAAVGFKPVEEVLVTLLALVVLVTGGNWLSGRTTRTPGAPARSSSGEGQGSIEGRESEGEAGSP